MPVPSFAAGAMTFEAIVPSLPAVAAVAPSVV
jgi:hypothetical protein